MVTTRPTLRDRTWSRSNSLAVRSTGRSPTRTRRRRRAQGSRRARDSSMLGWCDCANNDCRLPRHVAAPRVGTRSVAESDPTEAWTESRD